VRPSHGLVSGALLAMLACQAPAFLPPIAAREPVRAVRVALPEEPPAPVPVHPELAPEVLVAPAPVTTDAPELVVRPDEVRAVWVTRWDYASADDVRRAIANVRRLGADTVLFQVRGAADAFYRSQLEPWAEELGGADPGFDPLAVAVEAARAEGVKLHAYGNVFPVWKGRTAPRARSHLWNAHRDWVCVSRTGERQSLGDHYVVLNPAHPAARAHLVAVFADIARRYAVDGIHLDYVRYLSTDYSYDGVSLRRFAADTGTSPERAPAQWDQWRRDQVTDTVRAIVAACRAARPRLVVSAAVWRTPEQGHDRYLQDVPRWYRQGLLDWAFPMIYARDTDTFRRDLGTHLGAPGTVRVLPGIGAYLHEADPAECARQVEAARAAGATGFALFAYGSFFGTADTDGGYRKQDSGRLERLRAARREALQSGPLRAHAVVAR